MSGEDTQKEYSDKVVGDACLVDGKATGYPLEVPMSDGGTADAEFRMKDMGYRFIKRCLNDALVIDATTGKTKIDMGTYYLNYWTEAVTEAPWPLNALSWERLDPLIARQMEAVTPGPSGTLTKGERKNSNGSSTDDEPTTPAT